MSSSFFVFLSLMYICTETTASSESVYIITSPENHCPWEFTTEESCLTLQQYVYNPSLTSNISLRMEAGNHFLSGTGLTFSFDDTVEDGVTDDGTSVTILAEIASVIYSNTLSLFTGSSLNSYSPVLSIRDAAYVTLSGVTFMSDNIGYIKIENVQELVIEYCDFKGVQLQLYLVNNAEISKASFVNYSHVNDIYNFDHEYGALFVSQSSVKINSSNFTANQHAITYHDRAHERDGSMTLPSQSYSLQITNCVFTNNTSAFGGSAVNIIGSPYLSIQRCVFIFNTASGSGGAIHFNRLNETAFCSITGSTFVYNSAEFCGAFSIYNFYGSVEIRDSNFYYNSAVDNEDGVGGVGCIRNASISISNTKFIANRATGNAGALHLDESSISISNSYFTNNTARLDGGAMYTYAHSCDYYISEMDKQSSGDHFLHQTSIIAYTVLAVSATLMILLLVYGCASKVLVRCKFKPKRSGKYYRLSAQAEGVDEEDDDEELLQDHH